MPSFKRTDRQTDRQTKAKARSILMIAVMPACVNQTFRL